MAFSVSRYSFRNPEARDTTFDIARAICALYIVCFWHALDYLDPGFLSERARQVFSALAQVALGSFTFMSAYFLKRYEIRSGGDVLKFYEGRLKRFWPLYFIASLLLYLGGSLHGAAWYPSFTDFFLSLLGLPFFVNPLPRTMWYMAILMFFYWITPLILALRGGGGYKKDIPALALALALLFLLRKNFDSRILLHSAIFAAGLSIPEGPVSLIKKHALCFAVSGCLLLASLLYFRQATALIVCAGVVSLVAVSARLSRAKCVSAAATLISYSSLCMYLFHRHIYALFTRIPAGKPLSGLLVFALVCPCIILCSYAMQRIYDYGTEIKCRQ